MSAKITVGQMEEIEEQKTCFKCKNKDCYIVYGIPQEKKKDCKEHHENYDWDRVFDCKNHNKYKE